MAATTAKPSPYGAIKFNTIDEYHASVPRPVRDLLQKLRDAIRAAAPKAEETISYNMPAFKMNKMLVYYAAAKNHIGFYPTPGPIQYFKNDLAGYETSKGAIQFPIEKGIPVTLVKKIIKYRVAEDAAKTKLKNKK
jgi:uncharacterized protein YdhG (YjbR/CyaY superfamily)